MNTKLALAAAGTTALVLALTLILANRPHHPGETSAPGHRGNSRPATAPPTAATPTSLTAKDAQRLLPFDIGQITAAANLATTFATAYTTHRYDEPPRTYLDRLTPMMSPQLHPVIERAATDPVTLTQRHRLQEITSTQAHPAAIRAIEPTSITFLIEVTEQVATAHANRQDTTHYAITLTHATGSWQVYAIELAATGNTGQTTADRHNNTP